MTKHYNKVNYHFNQNFFYYYCLTILSFGKLSSKSDMRRKMTEQRNKSLGAGVKKAKKNLKEIVEILWETLTNLLKQKTKLLYYTQR